MFVLQVESNEENRVIKWLVIKNRKGYAPTEMRQERKNGKVTTKIKILMPGYVFLDEERLTPETYYEVKEVPHVLCFLGGKMSPAKLTDEEEEYIRELSNEGKPIDLPRVIVDEKRKVKVLSGTLQGYEGKVISINRRDQRITIEVNFAGESKKISLTAEIVDEQNPEGCRS